MAQKTAEEKEARREKEAVRFQKAVSEEGLVVQQTRRVVFSNLEQPSTEGRASPPLEFCMNFHSYRLPRRAGEKNTALYDGQIYDLPIEVIRHLNGLSQTIWGTRNDPVTGATEHYPTGTRKRFSCVPVEMFEGADGLEAA